MSSEKKGNKSGRTEKLGRWSDGLWKHCMGPNCIKMRRCDESDDGVVTRGGVGRRWRPLSGNSPPSTVTCGDRQPSHPRHLYNQTNIRPRPTSRGPLLSLSLYYYYWYS